MAVQVGVEEEEEDGGGGMVRKFIMPVSHLHHPLFTSLLDKAREVYCYSSLGALRLPCSIDDFIHIRRLIERESLLSFLSSFSLRTCSWYANKCMLNSAVDIVE